MILSFLLAFFLYIYMLLLLYQLVCIVILVLALVIQLYTYTCPIWKKVWDTITPTGTCMTLHFKYIYFNMNLVSPLHIAIIASIILGRLSTRFVSVSVGIFARSFSRAFVRSDPQSSFQFIPKVFDGVKIRAEWISQVHSHQTHPHLSLHRSQT